MDKYKGRRFASFLVCAVMLSTGFFFGSPENFAVYAQAVGALFFVYVTGQSATDWKKYSNGGA